VVVVRDGGGVLDVPGGMTLKPGAISSGVDAVLVKAGAGKVQLETASAGFRGTLVVDAGEVVLSVADALSGAGLVKLVGGNLQAGFAQSFAGLEISSGRALSMASVGPAVARDLTLGSAVLGGSILGANTIAVSAAGRFEVVSGNSISVSGDFIFGDGSELVVHSANALSAASGAIYFNGGVGDKSIVSLATYAGTSEVVLATAHDIVAPNGFLGYVAGVLAPVSPSPANVDQFMALDVVIKAVSAGKQLVAKSELVWNVATPGQQHGTFNVSGGNTFTIDALLGTPPLLRDNLHAAGGMGMDGWDGKTLTKKGAGELILVTENSYTGSTLVEDGVLTVRAANVLGAGSAEVDIGLQGILNLDFSSAAAATFAKPITGAGVVEKRGTNKITFTAASSYVGETRVLSGTLALGGVGSIAGSSRLSLASGASFDVSGIAGATAVVQELVGASGTVVLGAKTLMLSAGDFGGVISGAGKLQKIGSGALVLSGTNAFSGGLVFDNGDLMLAGDAAAGTGVITHASSGALVLADGLVLRNPLHLATGAPRKVAVSFGERATLDAAVDGAGRLEKVGDGALVLSKEGAFAGGTDLTEGTLVFTNVKALGSGAIAIATGSVLEGRVNTATLANELSGAGRLRVAQGSLALSGVNGSFDGVAEVLPGAQLSISRGEALGTAALELGGALRVTGAVAVPVVLGVSDVTLAASGGEINVQYATQTLILSAVLSGGALQKTGVGTLELSGSNAAYSSAVAVVAGGLTLASVDAAGTGGLDIAQNASLRVGFSGTFSNELSGAGRVHVGSGHSVVLDGNNAAFVGTLAVSQSAQVSVSHSRQIGHAGLELGDAATPGALVTTGYDNISLGTAPVKLGAGGGLLNVGNPSQTLTLDGVVSGNNGTLTKQGDGKLTLTGANTFTGGLRFEAGTLELGSSTAAGTGVLTHASSGQLSLGDGITLANAIALNGAAPHAIHVESGWSATLSGPLTGGAAGLVKEGAGRLELSRADALDGIVGAVTLARGTLGIRTPLLDKTLHGGVTSTLAVTLATPGTHFAISTAAATSSTFSGTVEITRGTLSLNDSANQALFGQAKLALGAEGTATLTGDASINTLAFNGGTLNIAMGPYAPAGLLTVGLLDISAAGGSLSADFGADLAATLPDPDAPLFDMWASNASHQRQVISAGTVNNVGIITWRDPSGAEITNGEYHRALPDGQGGRAGELVFNYSGSVRASGAPSEKGLWIGYGLVAVNADAGKTLQLDASASTEARLYASLGGAGHYTFTGRDAQPVEIGNATSDYTGATTVDAIHITLAADNALGATSHLTLLNGARIDMGTHATSVGTLDAADPATRITPGTLTINQGQFAGQLTGSGALIKTSPGTLTLSGANTHTGPLTIAQGHLRITGTLGANTGEADYPGPITLSPGATIELAQAQTQKLSGTINGDGTLLKTGPGTLIITATATHGATTITNGALQIHDDTHLGHGPNTLDNNATLILAGHPGNTYTQPWALAPGGGTLSTPHDATLATPLTGSGPLTKTGPGTLTLATPSQHTGPTHLEAGTLELIQANTLATSATLQLAPQTTLRTQAAQTHQRLDLPTNATYTATGPNPSDRNLTLATGTLQGTLQGVNDLVKNAEGRLDLAGTAATPILLHGKLEVSRGTLGLSADADGPTLHTANLAFLGTSTLDITGYAGTSPGNASHIFIQTDEIIPENNLPWRYTIAGANSTNFATLQLNRGPDGRNLVGRLDLAWNDRNTNTDGQHTLAHGTFHIEHGNTFRLDANLADRAPGFHSTTGWDGRTLTKTGGGLLTLANANTYTGDTLIREGTLEVTGSLGASPGDPTQGYQGKVEIGPDATLLLNQNIAQQVINGSITGTGTLKKSGLGPLIVKGPLALAQLEIANTSKAEFQSTTNLTNAQLAGRTVFAGTQANIETLNVSQGGEAIFKGNTTLGTAHIEGTLSFKANAHIQGTLSTTANALLELDDDIVLTLEGNTTLAADLTGAHGTLHNTTGHLDAWSIAGALNNDATAHLAGNLGGPLHNTGHAQIDGSVTGPIENAPTATLHIKGQINGPLHNAGQATIANTIANDIHNQAQATLTLHPHITQLQVNGQLYNSGLVHFGNLGQTLHLNGLHNETPAKAGHYNLEIDITGTSDHITIAPGGTITGTHTFDIRKIYNPQQTTTTTRIQLIKGGTPQANTQYSLAHPIDAGLYRLVLATPQDPTLIPQGYASSPQAAINATGAITTAWFAQLDNLAHRLGELHTPPGDTPPTPHNNDLWLRAHAQENTTKLDIPGIAEARQNQYGADIGYDHSFYPTPHQRLHLGTYAGYQTTSQRYHDGLGSKGHTTSTHLGLYATWIHTSGWHVDTTLKAQINEHTYDAGGDHGQWDSTQFGLSIEIGKRWQSTTGWYLEPTLHAAWSAHLAEGYQTTAGLHTRVANSDISRLGAHLRLGKRIPLSLGGHLQPYAKLGLETIHSTGGQVRITLGDQSERISPNLDGTRIHAGLGLNWQITPTHQIHLDYEGAWGGKYNTPWNITTGYKLSF
jgi:outer membrane autotransporter protein